MCESNTKETQEMKQISRRKAQEKRFHGLPVKEAYILIICKSGVFTLTRTNSIHIPTEAIRAWITRHWYNGGWGTGGGGHRWSFFVLQILFLFLIPLLIIGFLLDFLRNWQRIWGGSSCGGCCCRRRCGGLQATIGSLCIFAPILTVFPYFLVLALVDIWRGKIKQQRLFITKRRSRIGVDGSDEIGEQHKGGGN